MKITRRASPEKKSAFVACLRREEEESAERREQGAKKSEIRSIRRGYSKLFIDGNGI
jgi:hypothetical protein